MKVTIIGASGAVGLQITQAFLYKVAPNVSEINLIVNSEVGMTKVYSLIRDALVDLRSIKINVSKECKNFEGTDIIIFCAGHAVSQELKQVKHSNRERLYERNMEIVMKYIDIINQKCAGALFILVTNPVARIMANLYGKLNVKLVGVGVTNDTLRFRNALYRKFNYLDDIEEIISDAYIIGDHCSFDSLTYIENLLSKKVLIELLEEKECFDRKHKDVYGIAELKEWQEHELEKVLGEQEPICTLFKGIDKLPTFMSSYFVHRSVHFITKTSFSTSLAVLEMVNMFCNQSKKYMSAEVVCDGYCGFTKSVLGIPITFRDGSIKLKQIKYSVKEKILLNECANKNKIV